MSAKESGIRIGVLASGRGSNFIAIDDAIGRGEIKNAGVVVLICNRPEAGALEAAKERGIQTAVIDSKGMPRDEFDARVIDTLKEHSVDLVILAGFMKIIGKEFIEAFPDRIMNIHPSLLPSFKGLKAQNQALEYGVKLSGCTVHFVDHEMDTGPIILQETVPVLDDDTEETLSKRILAREHHLYPEAVKLFAEGRLRIEGRRVIIKKSD